MVRILVRLVLFVVIMLALPLSVGCSGLFSDPHNQANASVAKANEAINEHNRLFEEARTTYSETKQAIESKEDPSEETERVTQIRETMEGAQGSLSEAKQPLDEMQDLNVEPEIKEYSALLSEGLDTQISAEGQEIEYYRILEEDPGLDTGRDKALGILSDVSDGYQRAKDAYGRAQELADANPKLIKQS